MKIQYIALDGIPIAIVDEQAPVLDSPQSALDLIASIQYEAEAHAVVLPKEAVSETFFDLRSGLAGEILQKFINYHAKIAIVGDFSGYTSNALADFIRESNRGHDVFFVTTQDEAIALLRKAMA